MYPALNYVNVTTDTTLVSIWTDNIISQCYMRTIKKFNLVGFECKPTEKGVPCNMYTSIRKKCIFTIANYHACLGL